MALAGGCASSNGRSSNRVALEQLEYTAAPCSALVFDSPIAAGFELPGLDRETRQPGVFMGYQEATVEVYQIGTDDHQSDLPGLEYYDHHTMISRTGVRYR